MSRAGSTTYFLSCYLSPPDDLAILAPRHDQNVALWRSRQGGVELVRVWELERFTGQKHHFSPLFEAKRIEGMLRDLLKTEGVRLEEVSAIWGTPGVRGYTPIRKPMGAEALPLHSLAHLFSGVAADCELLFGSTIVGLAMDGAPDFALESETPAFWYAGCVARFGVFEYFPIESPGPLYSAAAALFRREPGNLMALATATSTRIEHDLSESVGGLRLFGGRDHPAVQAEPFVRNLSQTVRNKLQGCDLSPDFTAEEHWVSATMKLVQEACDLIVRRNVDRIIADHGVDPRQAYVAPSGGFALNCPANTRLMDDLGFKGLLTPPCANDTGQSLGLGLLGLHSLGLLKTGGFRLASAYCGRPAGDCGPALERYEPWIKSYSPFDPLQFAVDLQKGPLAYVDGAAELGPRALGHRSLLADPRSQSSKMILNKWKGREWWRPVAPIVLMEHVGDWFTQTRPSPYMLEVTHVRSERRAQVPAITHLDGTARHQTLTREVGGRLYDAMEAFLAVTGLPIVCNTSLNDRGEPIVQNAGEAINFCIRKRTPIAYIDGMRIEFDLDEMKALPNAPQARDGRRFGDTAGHRDRIWETWRSRGLSVEALFLLGRSPSLREAALVPELCAELNALASVFRANDPDLELGIASFLRRYGPEADFDLAAVRPFAEWEVVG